MSSELIIGVCWR